MPHLKFLLFTSVAAEPRDGVDGETTVLMSAMPTADGKRSTL